MPSKRTLRDYKNVVKPKQGVNEQIITEPRSITESFFDVQRYIVVIFDEVKIKDNLVWDKYAGHLIGFVDLGDLLPIFWNCLFYLEISLNLWVVAVVSDGASANRKFYRLHDKVGNQATDEVTYKVVNLYAKHWYIYFFADAPHPLKTS